MSSPDEKADDDCRGAAEEEFRQSCCDEGEMLTQETADHAQCENKAVVGLQGSCRCGRSALSMFEDRLRKRDGKCDICIYFM